MTNSDNRQSDALLNDATQALRDAPTPDGPSPDLVTATENAVRQTIVEPKPTNFTQRILTMLPKPRYAAAAIILIAAALLAWLTINGGGRNIVFADVVEKVESVRTAKWQMSIETNGQTHQFEYEAMEPGRMRWYGPDQGSAIIVDLNVGKAIVRSDKDKQVIVIPMPKPDSGQAAGMLALLQSFKNFEGTDLGEREIDDHATKGFGFEREGVTFEVWVDEESGLPVLIEQVVSESVVRTEMQRAGVPEDAPIPISEKKLTWSDFVYDVELDESAFSVEIPEGYKVIDIEQLKKQMMDRNAPDKEEDNGQ